MRTTSTKYNLVDPVCQIEVAKGSKAPSYVFKSETYYFCADSCRKTFMANPEKYLKPKPTKRKGLWHRYLDRLNKATGGKPPCCH